MKTSRQREVPTGATGGLPILAAEQRREFEAVAGAVSVRASDLLSYAHDASHYLLVPKAVITPTDAEQVANLLRVAGHRGLPLTFRSGGTSLSGQSTTDGLLVDTRRHFQAIEVMDNGARVRVQPGATVRAVNSRLLRHGRKLGPDPASEIACTIGGVVANNSSGMACGVVNNSYQTLESAVLVLPSGTVINTAEADADERLHALEPEIHAGLIRLRDRIRGNPSSVAQIRRQFAIKNTMGYAVNSFLDHTRPVDILTHLVVGSEGTLAFLAEATFRTVPINPHAATGLLTFARLSDATAALPALVGAGLATIELLDAASLRVAQLDPQADQQLRDLAVAGHAALLVEYQEPTTQALDQRITESVSLFAELRLDSPALLSTTPASRARLWHIRKGLYTAIAGARPSGTTALLEDIAVPVDRLLPTCEELTALFDHHNYRDSVIFGHAKDGNVHFMLNEEFDKPEKVQRYEAFTDELVDMVLGHGGTLKAEHGTGRIMAPYVERQYGPEIYDVMRQVKQLIDPHRLLNPDVLLTEDPGGHIKNLKSTSTVEEEVDRCVECGYCEPTCPSRNITTTPRRRIVLRREIARARDTNNWSLLETLESEYQYDAIETCAVDGLCKTACPVLIDTGDLTRRLRREQVGRSEQKAWNTAARHWDGTTRIAAAALTAAQKIPTPLPIAATAAGRKLLGTDTVPAWSADLPEGGTRRQPQDVEHPQAVYFAACLSTMFGPAEGIGVREAFLTLCDRAAVPIRVPESIAGMCCGTPWKSKGLTDGYRTMQERVIPALWTATENGALPIVVDATSCTEGLRHLLADDGRFTVIDAVDFVDQFVHRRLPDGHRLRALAIHPTCSSTVLGTNEALLRVASTVADRVEVPEDWGCCAFAGDRGMLHPELTASATELEARSVQDLDVDAYASVNRTCEMGLSRATGQNYRHILELLEEVTR